MTIIWPQEPFIYPEEDMMVYSTHKYVRTKVLNSKLDIQANIYQKRKVHKNCVLFDCTKRKRGTDVTRHLVSEGDIRPLASGGSTMAGSIGGNSGCLSLVFRTFRKNIINAIEQLGQYFMYKRLWQG